ncbi:hypothetical protein RKD20_007377 [Streptomyces sp. SLBN-8D4]|jgi:hypothetical protein
MGGPGPPAADAVPLARRNRRYGRSVRRMPELAWLRIVGPVEVDDVASIVTVYSAMSDDEAAADRIA